MKRAGRDRRRCPWRARLTWKRPYPGVERDRGPAALRGARACMGC